METSAFSIISPDSKMSFLPQDKRSDTLSYKHPAKFQFVGIFVILYFHVKGGITHMRKANREITNRSELAAVLEKCDVCRLGLLPTGVLYPYIVPMNFGYEFCTGSDAGDGGRGTAGDGGGGGCANGDGGLTLYFHCAREGRKLDIMAQNPNVCFEMDCAHELRRGDAPCDYSMNFESIIGSGRISVCTEREERLHGLTQIMRKYSPEKEFHFSEKALERTVVLKLSVSEFTGKRLKK
jgi:nitroimidazol reductase NimA-like FMN-containing flavoprotein (pyridoxamine 5'-phosphate oxidase superfamily)